MSLGITIELDQPDEEKYLSFLNGLKERLGGPTSRQQIVSILKKALSPLAESEAEFIEDGHSISGALADGLKARAGSGDRPGTVSVFSASAATPNMLRKTWGNGRGQQRGWAANLPDSRGRTRVFYAPFVHAGHRIVVRKGGVLVDTGERTKPVEFASQAVESLGDAAADEAADNIIDLIWGK